MAAAWWLAFALAQAEAMLGEPSAASPADCFAEVRPAGLPDWRRNASFLLALEASRQPQDLGVNANFGAALAANTAVPLGLGGWHAQLGVGQNLSRAGVKVLRVAEGTRARQQTFLTAGVFQRADAWHAGLAFDWQRAAYYDDWSLGQLRLDAGVAVGETDEAGLRGMAPLWSAEANVLGGRFALRSLAQAQLYWRHWWSEGGATTLWLGAADRHGTDIVTIPDRHLSDVAPVFGLEVFIPLSDRVALFGQGNYVTPSDTGTLDAFLGFEYFPGGGLAGGARRSRGAPLFAVANNPTFSVDLRRR